MQLFQAQCRSVYQVIGLIEEAVRFKILNFKVKCNGRVSEMLEPGIFL